MGSYCWLAAWSTAPAVMSLLAAQIVSMVCLGLITWIIGILPLIGVRKGWISESESQQRPMMISLFSCLICFGGGVILTSCLTHMLPDVNEVVVAAVEDKTFPDSGLPVAEILVLAGFLMIYLVEELMHFVLVKYGNLEDETHEKHNGGGHGHSHDAVILPTEAGFQAAARGFLVVLALSIHDLFEGVALGVARRQSSAWFLLLAFASHKWVISACLGLKWARSALRPLVAILYMSVFCAVSPIGVGVGMALTSPDEEHVNNTALIVLQGIATGSLLYVVFFEILEKERQKAVPGLLQVISMSLGFIFMVLLGLAEVRGEGSETEELLAAQ